MPTPTKGPRFGGSPAHQRIILANLASQLFEHGRITTTEAKAKRVQPLAEQLIAKAKRDGLHNRRQVLSTITDKGVVHVLFTEIAPLADRDGGYTRITKVGPRKGDNAPMAVIEIITESVEESRKNKAKGKGSAAAAPANTRPRPSGPRRPSRLRPARRRRRRRPSRRQRRDRRGDRRCGRRRRDPRGGYRGENRRGLRHQGQPRLDEVPHARVALGDQTIAGSGSTPPTLRRPPASSTR